MGFSPDSEVLHTIPIFWMAFPQIPTRFTSSLHLVHLASFLRHEVRFPVPCALSSSRVLCAPSALCPSFVALAKAVILFLYLLINYSAFHLGRMLGNGTHYLTTIRGRNQELLLSFLANKTLMRGNSF